MGRQDGGMASPRRPYPSRATQPLTVALVTETYPPEVNGVALTLSRLVSGLRERGHRVQLIRPRQSRSDTARADAAFEEILLPGLPIPRYPGLHFGLPARDTLRRLWLQSPPSIVHVATEGPLGASAVAAARELCLPVSSALHTHFDMLSRHYGLGWLRDAVSAHMRRLHNRSDVTLVPTQDLARQLAADGYRNVKVIARGVDPALFNPGRRSQELRARWGAGPDTLVVAHIGRIAPEKNLPLVARAYEAIGAVRSDVRMIYVGDGPMLARLARKQPQHLYAGLRQGEDLAAHYASADLFLFPSLAETFGNVVPEALASGLGIVAFDCAAAADLITDRVNGRKVAPGDEDAFIDAAVELARAPTRLTALRERAAPSVAHLDWAHIHDTFASTLAELVQAHRRRRLGEKHLVLLPY